MCDIYERRWRNVVAREQNDRDLGPCSEFRPVNMDTQTKCVVSQVFFLDVGDLDAAEIQRICNILGVPEPELQASPMAREETLPVHSQPELDKEPENNCKVWVSEAEGEPNITPSVLTSDTSGSDVENVNQSPPHSEAPQQFGDVISNTGHNIYMTEHNLTIPPPMQTLVPLGMHPVVVTNALGMSGVTSVCVVSVPAGIPALPGIPVHGLPPPFLPHPATFHGDPADLNFFQNHPPPNMSRMNPHVQEFVPGRDYIMRDDSCQSIPALHPHQQMPPQHLPPPVAFVTSSYAKLPTTHVTGASHPIQGFPSDGHPSGGQIFMVESDSVPPSGMADVFDPSSVASAVGEPLVANDFPEVQGLFPHVANSTVFSHHPVPTSLHLQEQSHCRNIPEDALHMPASGRNVVPDILPGDFCAASSHCRSATIPNLAAGDNLLNSIPVKQHTKQLLSAAISMPNDALSNSVAVTTLENNDDPLVQPFDTGLENNSWGHPFLGSNVENTNEGPLQALPKDGQESVMPEDGIVQSDSATDSSAGHMTGNLPDEIPNKDVAKIDVQGITSHCGPLSSAHKLPVNNKTEQNHSGVLSEAALAQSSHSLPATEAGFPVLNSGQGKPAPLINGVSSLNQMGTAPATDSVEETSEHKSQTVNTTAAAPPKMSWANLFKGSSSSSQSVVIYKEDTEKSAPVVSQPVPTLPVTMSAASEVVSVDNDSVAAKLGEYLSTVSLVHASVALQPRGLVNKANWCYVNATLQALVACPPFYHLFKNLAELPLLSRSASSTPILDSLVQFTSEFHKQERQDRSNVRRGKHVELVPGPIFEPEYVYKMLQHTKVSSSFKHGLQEDAEEFLSCVLDGLHEEMLAAIRHATGGENGASPTNGYPMVSNPSDNNADATDDVGSMDEDEWQEVGPKNRGAHTRKTSMIAKTPIAKMFSGLIRSAIMQASSKERATLQPFFTLQLDIQGEKVTSVREALEHFVSKESIQGFTCSKTGEEVEVVKRITLEELPPVLILHLKCFVYDQTGGCQKLIKNIKFDVDLNITKDLLSATGRSKLQQAQRHYKLFAVVFHHGKKATGGHYTTDVFHPGINGWVHMDDSRILPVQESEVLNYHPPKMPYLLYYRRRDLATPS